MLLEEDVSLVARATTTNSWTTYWFTSATPSAWMVAPKLRTPRNVHASVRGHRWRDIGTHSAVIPASNNASGATDVTPLESVRGVIVVAVCRSIEGDAAKRVAHPWPSCVFSLLRVSQAAPRNSHLLWRTSPNGLMAHSVISVSGSWILE